MAWRIGYIGNFYKIPEYIYHSDGYRLEYVIVEKGKLDDKMLTFLLVRNIPWIEVDDGAELVRIMEQSGIKQWITCSFGKRIPMETIKNIEVYNIHYAELPYYKGRHPSFWATVNNEKKVGISLHMVSEKLDEGDIIAQRKIPYYIWMNENELFERLTEYVPELLYELKRYWKGEGQIIKNCEGNYYPMVKEEDYTIDLEKDSYANIYNKVRAQSRYRGALLKLNNKNIWVKRVVFSQTPCEEYICVKLKENIYMIIEEVG